MAGGELALHTRVWHRHSGVKMLARSCKIEMRIDGRIREFRIGFFWDYCGFTPNDSARAMHQQVLEKVLLKRRGRNRSKATGRQHG